MNQVRIIGGRWRRRLLRFPDALELRPTPDRVRETLFNWLGQELDGQRVLDLFAGSGALGVEALSRGAVSVTLVESAAPVVQALRDNASALGLEGLEVLRSDALQFAARCRAEGRQFDLLLLDPPYRQGWWDKLVPLLDALVAKGGQVYVEAEMAVEPPVGWQVVRAGKAGQVFYQLLERVVASKDEDTHDAG